MFFSWDSKSALPRFPLSETNSIMSEGEYSLQCSGMVCPFPVMIQRKTINGKRRRRGQWFSQEHLIVLRRLSGNDTGIVTGAR